MTEQVLPKADVAGVWKDGEKYPTSVWVLMGDGKRFRYDLHIDQPGYQIRKADKVGYGVMSHE